MIDDVQEINPLLQYKRDVKISNDCLREVITRRESLRGVFGGLSEHICIRLAETRFSMNSVPKREQLLDAIAILSLALEQCPAK